MQFLCEMLCFCERIFPPVSQMIFHHHVPLGHLYMNIKIKHLLKNNAQLHNLARQLYGDHFGLFELQY